MGNQPTFNLFIKNINILMDYFFPHSSKDRHLTGINFLKKKYGLENSYYRVFVLREILIEDMIGSIEINDNTKQILMSDLNIEDVALFDSFILDCCLCGLFKLQDNILSCQFIEDHIDKVKDISKKRSIASRNRYKKTESPIEELFYNKLKETLSEEDFNLFIPQYEILPYYVDFGIPSKKIVVELDGHEFHSSKTQRTNDLKRQRYLQGLGWSVIRYTGTEIYKNLDRCVDDLLNLIKLDNE